MRTLKIFSASKSSAKCNRHFGGKKCKKKKKKTSKKLFLATARVASSATGGRSRLDDLTGIAQGLNLHLGLRLLPLLGG